MDAYKRISQSRRATLSTAERTFGFFSSEHNRIMTIEDYLKSRPNNG